MTVFFVQFVTLTAYEFWSEAVGVFGTFDAAYAAGLAKWQEYGAEEDDGWEVTEFSLDRAGALNTWRWQLTENGLWARTRANTEDGHGEWVTVK